MGAAHTAKAFEVGVASNLGVDARRGYAMESREKHGMCQSVYKSPSSDTVLIYIRLELL